MWLWYWLLFVGRLKDDVIYTYQGPRTKDSIIDFANRIAG